MGATKKLYEAMIERHNSLENHFNWIEQEYLNDRNYENTFRNNSNTKRTDK